MGRGVTEKEAEVTADHFVESPRVFTASVRVVACSLYARVRSVQTQKRRTLSRAGVTNAAKRVVCQENFQR